MNGQIWEAYEGAHWTFAGYLITEYGDVNRPIAMVQGNEQEVFQIDSWEACEAFLEAEKIRLRRIADLIACNSDYARSSHAIDLRAYGWLDSEEATPGFLYRLYVTAPGDQYGGVHPWPFCKFRFAEMAGLRSVMKREGRTYAWHAKPSRKAIADHVRN